jgi:acetyltransferase-like isoleucine patch superfamily enzyme
LKLKRLTITFMPMFPIVRKMYQRTVRRLVEREVARAMMHRHLVWGDSARLSISGSAEVHNALFNTMSGTITVEDHVFFGHNVVVLTGTHDVHAVREHRMKAIPQHGRDIIIRAGAWIATNSTIIGPAVIGEDAVVGAGAVVVGDVEPGTFVAGVPAKLVCQIDLSV